DIVVKSLFTHRDFKERYNAYKGTGLGMAHTLWQTAVFRPKHKSSKVKNLYYTGQYNHPGVGVPTTVISSQILVNELNKKGVLT
ncbi:MAG TPA: phytoene desaturase, partial [Candidatus Poseidoniia archaeon]|nr:phytoene desaturase [Candidatus Poseidoniia archaeon]